MIEASPYGDSSPSVSPDGKRIAYSTGQFGWDLLEVTIPKGEIKTLSSGGTSSRPNWGPSGTHFLFSTPAGPECRRGRPGTLRGKDSPRHAWFARTKCETRSGRPMGRDSSSTPRRTRFQSCSLPMPPEAERPLLDTTSTGDLRGMSWSPDGQWISYWRRISGKTDFVKIRTTPGATPEVVPNAKLRPWATSTTRWSPVGDRIAYPAADGIDLISPDGRNGRKLTSLKFRRLWLYKDGRRLLGVFQKYFGRSIEWKHGAKWQLYSVSVDTGKEEFLAPIDLPASVDRMAGFSIHPDGTRFLTSVAKYPFDLWMLEGFDTVK